MKRIASHVLLHSPADPSKLKTIHIVNAQILEPEDHGSSSCIVRKSAAVSTNPESRVGCITTTDAQTSEAVAVLEPGPNSDGKGRCKWSLF